MVMQAIALVMCSVSIITQMILHATGTYYFKSESYFEFITFIFILDSSLILPYFVICCGNDLEEESSSKSNSHTAVADS